MHALSRILVAGALCVVAACSGGDTVSASVDASVRDAAVDAAVRNRGNDAAGLDAALLDAGLDAGLLDSGADPALLDAGVDAAAGDAGVDAATDDAGVDAAVPGDCSIPLTCPSAAADKVTVCGRLRDVETDAEIRAASPNFASCGSGAEATDGPCTLQIKFYDALDFAGNPTGAAALPVQAFDMDDCGRYVAQNIDHPTLGFVGVVVDDAAAAPNDHRLTAMAFAASSAQVLDNQRTYVIRTSTDVKWSTDVGLGANTFVDRGVLMSIFFHGTTPTVGVTVTSNGSARPTDDYYFTDTDAKLRQTVTATGPTQANGAALLLGSSLVQHSGQGAEPSACVWPSDLGAAVPGVLWLLTRVAERSTGGVCP